MECKNCQSEDVEIIDIVENDKDIPVGTYKLCHSCKGSWKVSECEVYSRCCGYLRPTSQWNKGKQSEFKHRKTYKEESISG